MDQTILQACRFVNWITHFGRHAVPGQSIPLSSDFVSFILSETMHVPSCIDKYHNYIENNEPLPSPLDTFFPSLMKQICDSISLYRICHPNIEHISLSDAAWSLPDHTTNVHYPSDIMHLIKGSSAAHLFLDKIVKNTSKYGFLNPVNNNQSSSPSSHPCLLLKKRIEHHPSEIFRVYTYMGDLVGMSQHDGCYYESAHNTEYIDDIKTIIANFHYDIFIKSFFYQYTDNNDKLNNKMGNGQQHNATNNVPNYLMYRKYLQHLSKSIQNIHLNQETSINSTSTFLPLTSDDITDAITYLPTCFTNLATLPSAFQHVYFAYDLYINTKTKRALLLDIRPKKIPLSPTFHHSRSLILHKPHELEMILRHHPLRYTSNQQSSSSSPSSSTSQHYLDHALLSPLPPSLSRVLGSSLAMIDTNNDDITTTTNSNSTASYTYLQSLFLPYILQSILQDSTTISNTTITCRDICTRYDIQSFIEETCLHVPFSHMEHTLSDNNNNNTPDIDINTLEQDGIKIDKADAVPLEDNTSPSTSTPEHNTTTVISSSSPSQTSSTYDNTSYPLDILLPRPHPVMSFTFSTRLALHPDYPQSMIDSIRFYAYILFLNTYNTIHTHTTCNNNNNNSNNTSIPIMTLPSSIQDYINQQYTILNTLFYNIKNTIPSSSSPSSSSSLPSATPNTSALSSLISTLGPVLSLSLSKISLLPSLGLSFPVILDNIRSGIARMKTQFIECYNQGHLYIDNITSQWRSYHDFVTDDDIVNVSLSPSSELSSTELTPTEQVKNKSPPMSSQTSLARLGHYIHRKDQQKHQHNDQIESIQSNIPSGWDHVTSPSSSLQDVPSYHAILRIPLYESITYPMISNGGHKYSLPLRLVTIHNEGDEDQRVTVQQQSRRLPDDQTVDDYSIDLTQQKGIDAWVSYMQNIYMQQMDESTDTDDDSDE